MCYLCNNYDLMLRATEDLNKRPEDPKQGDAKEKIGEDEGGVTASFHVYALDSVVGTKFRQRLGQKTACHDWSKYCQKKVGCEAEGFLRIVNYDVFTKDEKFKYLLCLPRC